MPNLFIAEQVGTIALTTPWPFGIHPPTTYEPGAQFLWPDEADDPIRVPVDGLYQFWFTTYSSSGPKTDSDDCGIQIRKNGTLLSQTIITNSFYQSTGLGTGIVNCITTDVLQCTGSYFGGLGGFYFNPDGWASNFSGMPIDTPRLGWVQAYMTDGSFDLYTDVLTYLAWTPYFDTANTHDGSTKFIAPAGASAAVITTSIKPDLDSDAEMEVRVYVNGVLTRRRRNKANEKEFGGIFGLVKTLPGDEVQIGLQWIGGVSYRVIDGGVNQSSVTIEWV